MKTFKRGIAAVGLAGVLVGLVVACGGGGGGNFAGIDRLGVTNGTITGFGSIIVNGVHYEVNGQTKFNIDDPLTGSQRDLQPGQVITINWISDGTGATFRAKDVTYNKSLEGLVTSVNASVPSFVVLGQTVVVDAGTSLPSDINPQDLAGLLVGDRVEVSGLIDAAGAIRATRVERKLPGDKLEVRGTVSNVTATTFSINAQVVDYGTVPATLKGFSGPIADGDFVEAKGNTVNGSGQLVADDVELEDGGIPSGDDGEVEGYITRYVSPTDFDVGGVPVTTNGQTDYGDGKSASDLALNVKVEVEGTVNSSGVLVAEKVEFKSGDSDGDGDEDSLDGRVAANVTAVNPVAGTLTLAGVTVTVTPTTRFEDKTGAAGQTFGLDDISVGNYVEVRGAPGAGATLTAIIVERDAASSEGLLRGPVGIIAAIPNITVLGVVVITNVDTKFRDSSGVEISSSAFFNLLSNGSEVQVKFTQAGAPIVADEIELEDQTDT